VYIIIRLLFICLFVIMLEILGRNTYVLNPAIYSNDKRQWRVVVIKKRNETENYQTRGKLYISFDRCVQ